MKDSKNGRKVFDPGGVIIFMILLVGVLLFSNSHGTRCRLARI